MSLIYNTFEDSATGFRNFLVSCCPFLHKPALNIMPDVLTAMIDSLSSVTNNIALSCKGTKFDSVQIESINRRIRRFFNNKNYNPYDIFDSIINHVISKFSCKHGDNIIHVVFDHMFKSEQMTTFMMSLRIGKKSIPLWFRCFEGGHASEAFQEEVLAEGIQYVVDLFKDKPNYKIVFLADRWFRSASLLKFIESTGHFYIVRVPSDCNVWYFNEKENHLIKDKISNLFHYKHKATYYPDVEYTDSRFKTNLVFSATKSASISNKTDNEEVDEPWVLLTNCDMRRVIKWYSYRFGAIEFLFKDQKSNGFDLEKTSCKNIQAFTMMYTCVNICILFLTCISTYYSRHKNKFYKNVKIKYFGIVKGKHVRKISIFRVGLILFKKAFNSTKKILIPYNFILTDV